MCLLESGGTDPSVQTQSLYAGRAEGTVIGNSSRYLTRTRLRYFGGTTNHWTGVCRPLDPLDFTRRPWVPESGWPIDRAAVQPYEDQAAEILQIPPFDDPQYEGQGWQPGTILGGPSFITRPYHASPPTRFGERYRQDLADATNVRVYLHANVVGIDADESGSRVGRVRVSTLTGSNLEVVSRLYVLATGGIENARLLLLSDDVQRTGLGNGTDLVGRYFMDHLRVGDAGQILLTSPLPDPKIYSFRDPIHLVLCLAPELQREHRLLNAGVELRFATEPATPSMGRLAQALSQIDHPESTGEARSWGWAECVIRSEQLPNRDSRVTLSQDRDVLGMRQVALNWQLAAEDRESVLRVVEVIGLELGRRGMGRARVIFDESDPWDEVGYERHHMGTTRMSRDATTGVVDENCRLHGVSNLYVAGSSVFPTVGFANPTFTIVTLALRLADHLREVVKRE